MPPLLTHPGVLKLEPWVDWIHWPSQQQLRRGRVPWFSCLQNWDGNSSQERAGSKSWEHNSTLSLQGWCVKISTAYFRMVCYYGGSYITGRFFYWKQFKIFCRHWCESVCSKSLHVMNMQEIVQTRLTFAGFFAGSMYSEDSFFMECIYITYLT